MYTVLYRAGFEKSLEKIPKNVRRGFVAQIEMLKHDPRPTTATKLKGFKTVWRIRKGDYRLVYEVRDKELVLIMILTAHRKDIYRKLS